MKSVIARAATRVDLAGASLDLWPIGLAIPGALTVNVAVSLGAMARCEVTDEQEVGLASDDLGVAYTWRPNTAPGPLPLLERLCEALGVSRGINLSTRSDAPPGSGLGGSSALSVAVVLALHRITGRSASEEETVRFCRDVEASNLRMPTGVRDFWPALRGGGSYHTV